VTKKPAKTLAGKKAAARAPRADAQRNRDRLLAVAKTAFADKGTSASLEEIARDAGVGIGTLYRHFPTRDALIEALYSAEVEQLVRAADALMRAKPPADALRAWLLMFVDYIVTKNNMAEVLKTIVGSTAYAATGAKVKETIAVLANKAVASGDIVLTVEPLDLLRALAGVANLSAGHDARKSAIRTVDILMAGIRRK
jgi:AcrR family transcriptional regulator